MARVPGLKIPHAWLEWPGGSAGFTNDGDRNFGHQGQVRYPEEDHYISGTKVCTELSIKPCEVDVDRLWDITTILVKMDVARPPAYNAGVTDCRWWAMKIFSDAVPSAKGCTVL